MSNNEIVVRRTVVNQDPILLNIMAEAVRNAATSRSMLYDRMASGDKRRSVDDECGFPPTNSLTPQFYRDSFDRNPIAARVVEVMAKASWSVHPEIKDSEDTEEETEFEKAWDEVGIHLNIESWFKDRTANPVWEYLRRLDIMSGIGRFGVMLIGIDDGMDMREPVAGVEEDNSFDSASWLNLQEKHVDNEKFPIYSLNVDKSAAKHKLIFLRVFDESLVEISRWESNPSSPRYGQPIEYNITFNDPSLPVSGVGMDMATKHVHWTRVIHVADNLMSSEVIGVPRQQPVINNLLNLHKIYGGSAEGFWQASSPMLSFETHPTLGGDVEFDLAAMKDQMENVRNSLQKEIFSAGLSAKTLGPTVTDPTNQVDVQITAICIRLDVPKRIFLGSERGELSSSQDQGDWNNSVNGRNIDHTIPHLIIRTIDRFIMIGVLPQPREDGYRVVYPDANALSDEEKTEIASKRVEMLVKFIAGNGTQFMTEVDFLVYFFDMEVKEAEEIVKRAQEQLEEEMAEREEEAAAQGVELDIDGNPIPQAPPQVDDETGEEDTGSVEQGQAKPPANGGGNGKSKTPVPAAAPAK